jgi:hypothetical protein
MLGWIEDVACYKSGACGEADIGCVGREDSVTVVDKAIRGEESDETL